MRAESWSFGYFTWYRGSACRGACWKRTWPMFIMGGAPGLAWLGRIPCCWGDAAMAGRLGAPCLFMSWVSVLTATGLTEGDGIRGLCDGTGCRGCGACRRETRERLLIFFFFFTVNSKIILLIFVWVYYVKCESQYHVTWWISIVK